MDEMEKIFRNRNGEISSDLTKPCHILGEQWQD